MLEKCGEITDGSDDVPLNITENLYVGESFFVLVNQLNYGEYQWNLSTLDPIRSFMYRSRNILLESVH